ncbi:unnamed protein product [Pleuronectes platessa]|uniref:Uncharacterized protein n=1 Tax=Pleuronectes platessa TaxID=8262 RepID=A0A9N7YZV6_PLEPL|nr:unnamed protein product [Pleuronectes platessa]
MWRRRMCVHLRCRRCALAGDVRYRKKIVRTQDVRRTRQSSAVTGQMCLRKDACCAEHTMLRTPLRNREPMCDVLRKIDAPAHECAHNLHAGECAPCCKRCAPQQEKMMRRQNVTHNNSAA